jgi:hypothetical protein
MAPRAKWSKDDVRPMAQLAAIFVVTGVLFGLLRGDGVLIGAVAGALLFGLMIGVGSLFR